MSNFKKLDSGKKWFTDGNDVLRVHGKLPQVVDGRVHALHDRLQQLLRILWQTKHVRAILFQETFQHFYSNAIIEIDNRKKDNRKKVIGKG
jgi:hypothetical protein